MRRSAWDAMPDTLPIQVIEETLVTEVSTRPLSLEEIIGRGIVVDEQSFDYYDVQLELNFDGAPYQIDLPVAVPRADQESFLAREPAFVERLLDVNRELQERMPVELPPELQRSGIDFSIAAIPFMPVSPEDEVSRPWGAPPITGLVVIPGHVGFLNQFFSVQLVVFNVAPDGTPLVVRDVTAEVTLPAGPDRVPGTVDQPGDDPLRLARIEGIGIQPIIPVKQPGPDGELGTADDVSRIAPQASGEGEFLVEGLTEGFHSMDMTIHATLDGLPSGPVDIMGMAVGSVLVKDPTFSIVLSHPDMVRAGETYDLYATVYDTGDVAANLVSVNLNSNSVSGARLVSGDGQVFDALAPGESGTARFTMVAQKTGRVTAASLNSDPGLSALFQLRVGIGERGVPLAPNVIVLPVTASEFPPALVSAAQRVLGQALSTALAGEALPPDVIAVPSAIVRMRGRELAEAGQRIEFGEPLQRVLPDLLLDWRGGRAPDDGFDQLLRQTDAGRVFLDEIGRSLGQDLSSLSVADLHEAFARVVVAREPSLTVAVAGAADLRVEDARGLRVGLSDLSHATLPYAAALDLTGGAGGAKLVALSAPVITAYTAQIRSTASGPVDVSAAIRTPDGGIDHLRFDAGDLPFGALATLVIDPGGSGIPTLEIDTNADGQSDRAVAPVLMTIQDQPPALRTVRQLESCCHAPPERFATRRRTDYWSARSSISR
jgi:hypothetical protein